mmetsp:Transcript_82684/g.164164  ORF Transcript_82684/g.164164 Transcript_82684/m.164164 type:complete len:275 (-) Transcript_82684:34-858(-)
MGSARLLLLFVLQLVSAQESCDAAAESCAEGVEGVVDSRSMLALKHKRALTANDAQENNDTKPFSMGSNAGKAKKCRPEKTGLICEDQKINGQKFIIVRPKESRRVGYLEADQICATKVNEDWTAGYLKDVPDNDGWKEDLVIRCRSPDSFQLRSDSNFSKCLDWAQSHNDNILMWTCHNGNNQKWFWAGSQLRSVADKTKCITKWGWNVKAMECLKRGSKDQKIIDWDKKLEFDSGNCLDWDHGGWYGKTNVLNWRCHWGNNQKWTKLASHLE